MNKNLEGWLTLFGLFIIMSFLGNPSGFKQIIINSRNAINDLRKWINRQ